MLKFLKFNINYHHNFKIYFSQNYIIVGVNVILKMFCELMAISLFSRN